MEPDAYVELARTEDRHWWFVARREILSSQIERLGLPGSARILEIGSGTGGNLRMLSRHGRVCGMEMDGTARELAVSKTGAEFDIRPGACPNEVPYVGDTFDLVCLFDVLEHIEEDSATLEVVRGLLADRGHVLVSVPAYQWMWSAHDEFLHHKRRYTAPELAEKLRGASLSVDRITYFNTLLFPFAVAARFASRGRSPGTGIPSDAINSALRQVFSSERRLLQSFDLPFGLSLLAIASAA
ncbi:bifunctional 2-polyprenyl-6-hydroxyphenol methylase/3-demethylubiquinol 3-O-methyltransferase UbiG [Methyloceanibacter sp. wino2]|uniref:class I SAM-dependent methyltransferase n=1 Tax=Methyloceanibacter sp. wino2 TaxID=2170729 RepID=UPI000D3E22E1|nr:class I SAM-dependent methyltransferase [Methyloceanibacter sp. wino2]